MPDPKIICVDLDGTLVRSDTLWEQVALLLKTRLRLAFLLPIWLLRGKAHLKARIARLVNLDVAALPYHEPLIAHLRQRRAAGDHLVLATGANQAVARAVAEHLDLFDEVLASDESVNLTGARKLAALQTRFPGQPLAYAGNGPRDLPIWLGCQRAILVDTPRRLANQVEAAGVPSLAIDRPDRRGPLKVLIKALRVQQWVKNLLLFAPMAGAHLWWNRQVWESTGLAFAAFCLLASSVYLLNDLLDLANDRQHPTKRNRPLASGEFPLALALALIPLLAVAGLGLGAWLGGGLFISMLVYLGLTLAYSWRLKREVVLDILVLAGLYTLRVIAGGEAGQVHLTSWFTIFTTFLFLSLAVCKRHAELHHLAKVDKTQSLGRGYRKDDQPFLLCGGLASGYLAALVFTLYLNSPLVNQLYRNTSWLWLICPAMLYWISRVWLLAHRGEIVDDPVLFVIKDKASYVTGLVILAIVVMTAL
ncbi:MAG: UbiA family prenyltransferase [Desulfarculus sp.]|nr:UbiA family prenyltransferase [Desulfarculus sp.]